jgi:hypothetical protein
MELLQGRLSALMKIRESRAENGRGILFSGRSKLSCCVLRNVREKWLVKKNFGVDIVESNEPL